MATDAIYSGGPIVTVDDRQPTAEAVAIKDGIIVAVGARGVVERDEKGLDWSPHRRIVRRREPGCPSATRSRRRGGHKPATQQRWKAPSV